jgi:flagellar hook assembly protein FlgD
VPGKQYTLIRIFNCLGTEVNCLESKQHSAGINSVQWDGSDASGRRLDYGVYFYRLEYDHQQSETGKMILLDR